MKFSEMTYKRPDFETVKTEIRAKLDAFKNAKNAEEQIRCLDENFIFYLLRKIGNY